MLVRLSSALCIVAMGCSSTSAKTPAVADSGAADADVEGGGGDAGPTTVTQTGQILALQSDKPVAGAKVTAGNATATTDANGGYMVVLDPKVPFNLKVASDGYYSLLEQEALVGGNIDLGTTKLLPESTATLLISTLNGYDATLGILSVGIEKQGCADEGGALISYTVDGQAPTSSKLTYTASGVPSGTQTSAAKDSFPHAIVYNLPPGKPVSVTVTHPACKMIAFPVDKPLATGSIRYTSATLTTTAGKSTSFLRVFLK